MNYSDESLKAKRMSNSKSEDTPEPYTPHRIGLHSDDRPYSGEPLCYCDKPQDTSLTKITAEYFMATDPDRVALQRKVLAWHKAEIAKLFDQIRSEVNSMYELSITDLELRQHQQGVEIPVLGKTELLEALTRLEQK